MKKEIRNVDKERGITQITTYDERWYAREVKSPTTGLPIVQFVPSVTWIAGFYPKGIQFYKWLAEKGWDEAEAIKSAAGDKGSKVHYAITALIKGEEIKMGVNLEPGTKFKNPSTGLDEELTVQEYECVMSFASWFNEIKPEVIANEYVVFDEVTGYAGTVDLKCKINGELYIVDFKTGASVWPEYELQVSAYRNAETEVCKTAILQVGYKRNKAGFKFTEVENKFDLFLAAHKIWKSETEGVAPSQKDYPLVIKLDTKKDAPVEAEKVVKVNKKQKNA